MRWEPFTCRAALIEQVDGLTLCVDQLHFGPTHKTKGLGAIVFALGLDHDSTMFHAGNCPPMSYPWLVWHFCWLVSHRQDDPDICRFVATGLEDAATLVQVEHYCDIKARFDARLAMVRATGSEGGP